jgi:hypothetical protein
MHAIMNPGVDDSGSTWYTILTPPWAAEPLPPLPAPPISPERVIELKRPTERLSAQPPPPPPPPPDGYPEFVP